MDLFPRFQKASIEASLRIDPIVVIQGARQVGKSTLLQTIVDGFGSDWAVVQFSLDDSRVREMVKEDPLSFVRLAEDRTVIIDEAQRNPDLILDIKAMVDRNRRPGMFILTGSSDLLHVPGISDSLAGRVARVNLYPLSMGEIERKSQPEDFVSFLLQASTLDIMGLKGLLLDPQLVLGGGYPEAVVRNQSDENSGAGARWLVDYAASMAIHDVKDVFQVRNDIALLGVIKNIAGAGVEELNSAKLSRLVGVSEATMVKYINTLTIAKLTYLVRLWNRGITQREVKRPKIMLNDSGLAAALNRITFEKINAAGTRELYGSLVEQFVITELTKQQSWSDTAFEIYHFRDRDGVEVDIVLKLWDGSLIAIKVKPGSTYHSKWVESLKKFKAKTTDRKVIGVLFYTGDAAWRVDDWINVLPISTLWRHP